MLKFDHFFDRFLNEKAALKPKNLGSKRTESVAIVFFSISFRPLASLARPSFFFRSPFGRLLRLHGPRIHFVLFSASFFNEVLVWLSWLLFFAFCLLLFNFVCAFRFYVYAVVFTLLFFFVFAVCLFSVLGSTFVLCFC